jgi:hypothetical protein
MANSVSEEMPQIWYEKLQSSHKDTFPPIKLDIGLYNLRKSYRMKSYRNPFKIRADDMGFLHSGSFTHIE